MKDLTQSIGRQTFAATPEIPGHYATAQGNAWDYAFRNKIDLPQHILFHINPHKQSGVCASGQLLPNIKISMLRNFAQCKQQEKEEAAQQYKAS